LPLPLFICDVLVTFTSFKLSSEILTSCIDINNSTH
jgi:hypothetical protein